MQEESKEKSKDVSFESLRILSERWKNGTFSEIIDDWKWIFGYSARYKGAIVFYTILGILSTSLGLVGSVAGKYLIDIITGYQIQKLPLLLCIMIGSTVFSLGFESVINRISTKLGIAINNDIQADIFDKIVDADWLEISKYETVTYSTVSTATLERSAATQSAGFRRLSLPCIGLLPPSS